MKTIKLITENSYLKGYDEKGELCCHLPLNNSPILEGVDLLPPLEIDEDFNPIGEYTKEYLSSLMFDGKSFVSDVLLATRLGHNKAREKYKFTEEDMRYMFEMGYRKNVLRETTFEDAIGLIDKENPTILPIAFECEESIFFATNAFSSDITLTAEGLQDVVLIGIKKTTNSQGQTQWVGKYIYD